REAPDAAAGRDAGPVPARLPCRAGDRGGALEAAGVIALAIHYAPWLTVALLIGLATGWWIWGARPARVEADEPIAWPPPHELPAPAPAAPALAADDLTAIRGIDAEIEGRLRDLGVTRFSQIAGWLPAD